MFRAHESRRNPPMPGPPIVGTTSPIVSGSRCYVCARPITARQEIATASEANPPGHRIYIAARLACAAAVCRPCQKWIAGEGPAPE